MPSEKRKIVFVLPMLCAGGAERVQITFANNLDPQKFDVEFLTLADGPIRGWIRGGIPVHNLQAGRIRGGVFKLYRKFKELKPDVVVSSLVQMNALVLLLKPFFPETKFIVRESSLPSALMREYGWKGRLCKYIYKYLYPRADAVISPTRVIIDEFEKELKLGMKNHQVLFNPVDRERIRGDIDAHFDIPAGREKTVHFICAGRLSFEKGFDRLIAALPGLDLPYEWRLDILGEGKEKQRLEALITKMKLEDKVFLRGYESNPWNAIARADCLLLPSLWEGMPNIALEALACGTRVIGLKQAGGIADIHALAPEAAQTADTLDEMLHLMGGIEPNPKACAGPSMLPEDFLLSHVMKHFERLAE